MTDFLSNANKEFIWNLLSEQKIFDGINPKYKPEIQEKFEKTLLDVSSQGRYFNLVEKNKEIIRLMVLMVDDYKKKQIPYTSLEIQELRQKKFNNELQKKQNEFNGSSNKPIIDDINFADTKDSPLEESMDVLLARAMAVRENQLNQVLDRQDTQVASEWIGTSKTSGIKSNSNIKTNNGVNNVSNIINLKIGSETTLKDEHVVSLDSGKNSRVSFNERSNSVFTYERENDEENNNLIDNTSILSKFKKTNNTTNNKLDESSIETINLEIKLLNIKLDKILLNQMDILEYINIMRIK